MNILLIGSGGREHALAWKLKQSPLCSHLYIAPGNAGTALCGTNLPLDIADFDKIAEACTANNIEMLIVGPEDPLVNGITDFIHSQASLCHIHIIGPSKDAAQLEGSKAFAKRFMTEYGIPTALYKKFCGENYDEGVDYIKKHPLPVVLKADGLAAGKGVVICQNHVEALAEFELMVLREKFGEAGRTVVIEQFLKGIEMSVFVLTDGTNYLLLPEAKDYKRVGEKDTGLNTGGMGAVSPVPFFNEELKQKVISRIVKPTLAGLQKENLEYKGFIFLGLIVENGEPYMIEYNCRLGDPETEVVLPRIKNDLVELLMAVSEKRLNGISVDADPQATATVVAVSGGYPGKYETGRVIEGLETDIPGSIIFHSGTEKSNDKILTKAGRVLAVTSFGDNITEAAEQSNYLLEQLHFDDMYFRSDIGYEFK